jgi:very-short-patch-repair endonuclease
MGSQVAQTVPQRAANVFAFLKDLLKMRNRPAATLTELARKPNHWVHHLDSTTTMDPRLLFWTSGGMVTPKSLSVGNNSLVDSSNSVMVESRLNLLSVPKIVVDAPPEPSPIFGPWIDGDIQDPESEINLIPNFRSNDDDDNDEGQDFVSSDDDAILPDVASHSEYELIQTDFLAWHAKWQIWASETKKLAEVKKLYQSLFDTRSRIRDQDQDWELVLGIGRLRYAGPSVSLDRHLFTVQCDIDLDEIRGTLTVRIDDNKVFVAEDDWVIGISKPELSDLKSAIEEINEDDIFESDRFKEILNRFANKYLPGLATDSNPRSSSEVNSLKLAPSLILRKKTGQALVKVLEHLEEVTIESGAVSLPMLSILDSSNRDLDSTSDWSADGAAVFLDDEIYLPLSLNENQKRALKLSESRTTTLIQGPPGTGKTRTIATMLTHFLSKGERVLVTAATSQALREVSSQIPKEMRDLVVSNLGKGKSSGDDLQKAVNSLQAANENRSELTYGFDDFEKSSLAELGNLHRKRSATFRQIIDIRSLEVGEIELEGVVGTPAHHAYSYLSQSKRLGWFDEISDNNANGVPFDSGDAQNLKDNLRAIWGDSTRIASDPKLPDKSQLWTYENLSRLVRYQAVLENFKSQSSVTLDIAKEIITTLELASQGITVLSKTLIPWVTAQTESLLLGVSNPMELERLKQAEESASRAIGFIEQAGGLNEITCGPTNINWLPVLESLKEQIKQRGDLELNSSGQPKAGIFRNSIVKKSKETLAEVKILGRFPNNEISIDRIISLVKTDLEIQNLTTILSIHESDLPTSRVASVFWLNEIQIRIASIREIHQLMAQVKVKQEKALNNLGYFLGSPEELSRTIDACQVVVAKADVKELESQTRSHIEQVKFRFKGEIPIHVQGYLQAIEKRDLVSFDIAVEEMSKYVEAQQRVIALRGTVQKIFHPDIKLTELFWKWIDESPDAVEEAEICDIIDQLIDAFRWKRVRDGLSRQVSGNYDFLFSRLKTLEVDIELRVRELSRRRAWKKALDRIGSETLEYMSRYAVESKKLGAGTGMSATRRRRDIRAYLDKCTDAIPAWIMPISRIAESFNPQLEMFDVVIVDEASQAGIDALFLLALGKRVVVVGDHKQVSPDSMYMKLDDLREIVTRHLSGDPREANWSNTDFSLFDECKSVFGAPLTLTEHRRCVPAIIGFSNEIAYIPDGIRLIPVRQTGAQSLQPIKTVFISDGYVRGSTSAITNPPEAEKIVEIIGQMIDDEAYKGLTIGVITLQGTEQQNLIRNLLLDHIDTQEIEKREIRVGNASSFQGSERDVILLSMVMAPNKKFTAQTKENMIQRYNVAMSRAKDQVVLVHSLRMSDIKNENDLRWRLLSYCLAIEEGRGAIHSASRILVSEDTPVAPFDSLFEQRVYNRIIERGYSVISQYEPNIDGHSYRIDLVVVGPYGMLAVECDGDFWHGPEEYERDLRRQQILESCNWKFFRIQESEFYNNPESLLELWPMLEALGVSTDKPESVQKQIPAVVEVINYEEIDADTIDDFESEEANDDRDLSEGTTEDDFSKDRAVPISTLLAGPVTLKNDLVDSFKPLLPEEIQDGLRVREFSKQLAPEFFWLKSYIGWDREDVSALTHVARGSNRTRTELREIVRVEGPILGSYLMRRHYKATGGSSLSSSNEKLYIRQLEYAVTLGELLAEDRTLGTSIATATFRLPDQQPVQTRIRGARDLYDMPPREIAYIIRNVIKAKPGLDITGDRESVYRQVLQLMDFTKLTKKSEEFLDKILAEYMREITS